MQSALGSVRAAQARVERSFDPRAQARQDDKRERQLARLQAAAAKHNQLARRERLATAIAETRVRYLECRCPLHDRLTDRELTALGAGCTASTEHRPVGWVCPRLDAVRRRMGL